MARNSTHSAHSTGARAVGGGGARRRPAWLLPLLALLALLLIAAVLFSLLGGDDDDKGGQAKQDNAQPQAQASGGSVTAGGQSLLPASPDALKAQVGQDASAKGVSVQSIVEGEGFWVGTSAKDRLYVEFGGGAGKTEGGFRPDRVGQKVNLDGPVRPAPADPADTLRLPAPDAAQVKEQGAFINANAVQPAEG